MFGKWPTGKGLNPTCTVFYARLRQGGEVPALVFAVPRRSSAARAAHRELRSLLRLFLASNACYRCARPPCLYDAILRHTPRRSRANGTGMIGPKQT